MFATLYRALKPGGVLGVVEHRGNAAIAQDPKAKSGYVNEDYAIRLIEGQGFRLVGESQVNANPKDTKDYEQGVWTLPPTYRLGDKDRQKYAEIGESDRFTLKFDEAEEITRGCYHISFMRAVMSRVDSSLLPADSVTSPILEPWKVAGSRVFNTFSVRNRLRPP